MADIGAPSTAPSPGTGDARRGWVAIRALLPSRADYAGLQSTWRRDVLAGVTVGVVALPLALAFGVTAGLGAKAGLITAVVAGLVAAVFGGSHVQVSGPTGAMTVVLVPLVTRHGPEAVLVVGLVAGLVLVVAAVMGFGRYLVYIPWPVIEGFTLGIALIIFLQQVPAALGVPKPEGDNTAVVAFKALGDVHWADATLPALIVVAIVAAVMIATPRIRRGVPASLIAVVVATVVSRTFDLDVSVIGSLPSTLPAPSFPSISWGELSELWSAVFAVAALGALESLLSAKVADGMSGAARHDPNRELFGQGLANLASPCFGGMPATGAIARTAVNIKAGAQTRAAAIVHALLLVAVVYAGSGLVSEIPLAALAGVLMVTAARMVDVHNVRSIVRATRSDALILGVTCAVTVAFDLIVAVEVGMAVAAVLALRHLARTSVVSAEPVAPIDEQSVRALRHEHIVVYRLDGALFFGAVQRFFNQLTAIDDVRVVILRLPELQMLDATGAQALGDVIDELERRHITVLLKGPRPHHRRILEEVGALARLAHQKHLFDDLDDAIAHARDHAQRPRPPAHHPPASSPTITPADRVVATTGSRRSQP